MKNRFEAYCFAIGREISANESPVWPEYRREVDEALVGRNYSRLDIVPDGNCYVSIIGKFLSINPMEVRKALCERLSQIALGCEIKVIN